MKKSLLIVSALLLSVFNLYPQESGSPELKVKPVGRVLMDAAAYAGNTQGLFKMGAGIPDVRIGASASYGKWDATVEMGYANAKVSLQDIYLKYNFNSNNFLKIGNFIHEYGLQSVTSSSMKCTMEEPTSNNAFSNPRLLGVMFQHSGNHFFGAASAHVEPNATIMEPTAMGQQGYGLLTRLVWRPIHETGKILQIGVSGAFSSPKYEKDSEGNQHHLFRFKANFPTRVDKHEALNGVVDHAMNLFQFTPELLAAYGPLALEAQYYYNQVNRRDNLKAYKTQGAYGTLRGLILGGDYCYQMNRGGLATPRPKSLEVCLMYNYSTLSDNRIGIHGGRVSDISCTFNYYINKYMLCRIRYGFTKRWDLTAAPDIDLSAIQARLQIIF